MASPEGLNFNVSKSISIPVVSPMASLNEKFMLAPIVTSDPSPSADNLVVDIFTKFIPTPVTKPAWNFLSAAS